VSDDAKKLRKLGKKYKVDRLCGYDEYDELLASGEIDAVYIALPNHLHRDYAVRAARQGIHVLCEKPMEITSSRCQEMIGAAREGGVRLMIAYRLHFEEANLKAVDLIENGKIGEPRLFNSVFTLPVKDDNIRTNPRKMGGGPVFDIGIYCINAARYLFQDEPTEIFAMDLSGDRKKFRDIEETMAVTMRFPGERVASFTVSYGAASEGFFEVVGTKGSICLENAYEFVGEKVMRLTVKDKEKKRSFGKRDQVAPEIEYFSDCVMKGKEPEPSGLEGLLDVRIIEAIFRSSENGELVRLERLPRKPMPGLKQEIRKPPVRKPELVNAEEPSKEEAA
jgi:glucose-fructose oxidoreductase